MRSVSKSGWGTSLRWFLIGAIMISAGVAATAFAQQTAKGEAPKIEFSETVFDLGDVPSGEKAKHVFTVYNRGKAELQIKSVKPT